MSEEKKTGMMKSHAECFGVKKSYPKSLCEDYTVRGVSEEVVNGRILRKSCSKVVHPQDMFKGIKCSDFALENVIAAGAVDMLKEGYLHVNTVGELSDGMESSIDNIIAAVDAEENVNNNATNSEE